MSDDLAIEATALVKRYRSVSVLSGVDLRVPAASCYALLGPNGAGKTTTVRILCGLINADDGCARVAGCDVRTQRRELRRRISLTGQYAALDDGQTGAENLHMVARLSGLTRPAARRRARDLLARFELTDAAGRRVGTYSGGMRRRLDLAASLVSAPSVIFLDEPTTGLDLPSRMTMWQIISELRALGVTVLLTTQYLEEADQLADRVAVIDGGQVLAEGTPAELKQQVTEQRIEITAGSRSAFDAVLSAAGRAVVEADAATLTLAVGTDGSAASIRRLLDELDPGRSAIASFSVRSASLDDVFLAITGRIPGRSAAAQPAAAQSGSDLVTVKESSHV
jgi:ABC-2 type transport system ATP-binding protein